MAKVIMTIAPEDGMCFEDIMSFKTINCVGIWDSTRGEFALMRQFSAYFEPLYIVGRYENLQELDNAVFEECSEHITEVFNKSNYTIELG